MHYKELIDTLQKLTKRKITQKELSKILNITAPTTMSGRASRNSKFSTDEIRKIEKYFNINILSQNFELQNSNINEINAEYYDEISFSISTGIFSISGEKENINIPKKLINSFKDKRKYIVTKAFGNSMNPYILNGDKLIIELIEQERIKDNQVYMFFYNDQIFIKRLIRNVDQLIIKSDNSDPIYKINIIENKNINDLHIIGRVSGLIREIF